MQPSIRLAGAALSAVGHAALIALAAWALPWLRARPGPPVPDIAVSLVSPAELDEITRRAAARAAAPAPEPAPTPAPPEPAPPPAATGPRFVTPEPEPPQPEPPAPDPRDFTLAPSFDAASPLGLPAPVGTPPPEAVPADPGALPAPEAAPDLGLLRARHMQALAAAVLRARVYPPAARGRGVMGTAQVYLEVGRDGGLLQAGLMSSSGAASLDRAALEAARRARFPAAPDDLPGESFAFVQELEFEAR